MKIIENFIEIILTIMEQALKIFFESLESVFRGTPMKREEYKADFAPPSLLLSRYEKGFCLTGRENISIKNSYMNCLAVGGSGSGKTSTVLIPTLFRTNGSFVINDPSGELFEKCASGLMQRGYEIKRLHFACPEVSSGYNLLDWTNTSSEIRKTSKLLIDTPLGTNSKDPFWNLEGVNLLSVIISLVKKLEPEYSNLYTVRSLLNNLGGNPEAVDRLFTKHADDALFNEYKSIISYEEKLLTSIVATCKSALTLFADDSVAKVTSFSTIDFEDFRRQPTALFINNSVADSRYYNALVAAFHEQFFSYILSRFPEDWEQDIFFLIDECSSLKLPTLPMFVANARKHRAGSLLVVQSISQLTHNYGAAESVGIQSNCFSKIFFSGQDHETSKQLEAVLGKFQYKDKDNRIVVRSLLTSDEIRMIQPENALLISGAYPPMMLQLKPYYQNSTYRQLSSLPAPDTGDRLDLAHVPVLPLHD